MYTATTRSRSGPASRVCTTIVPPRDVCSAGRALMSTAAVPGPTAVSEPEIAGLEMAPSIAVKPPRVKKSPVAFECKYWKTIALPAVGEGAIAYSIVIGEVVGIYIDDAVIIDGRIDLSGARPIARLGYLDQYAVVDTIFKMRRPG